MLRRIVLPMILTVFTLVLFLKPDVETPETYTKAEIDARISAEKHARRAERSEAGLPFGPGTAPSDWAFLQRAYPYDRINYDDYLEGLVQAQALRAEAAQSKTAAALVWQEEGPSNIGGRVVDLAMDPVTPNRIYAAMASGGIFRSDDSGVNWTPIFDDQTTLTIGDIAIDPNASNVLWAGTGEANGHSFSWFGMGIFKSTDTGATWEHKGLENTRYIGRVVVDANDGDRVWVAATGVLYGTDSNRGVYRTTDGGDNWSQVLYVNDSTSCIDIVTHPTNTDTIFAAMWERVRGLNYRTSAGPASGIYRSYNGGTSWTKLGGGLPTGSSVGRIGVAISPDQPQRIYASIEAASSFDGVYRSDDLGTTWSKVGGTQLNGTTSSFGWYFGQVRTHPDDADYVYQFGVSLNRSTNGGTSWSGITGIQHVDFHAMAFDPFSTQRIFSGNDGGVYVSQDRGSSWTKLFNQPTNQFYAVEIDPHNPARLYGGTQDNGTMRTTTGATDDYQSIFGGDGFVCLVSPSDSATIFVEYQNGNMFKSTDYAQNFSWGLNGVDGGDRRNWNTPYIFDPSNDQTMYYGTYRVWKSTDEANNWTAISNDLTNGNQGANFGTITALATSPSNGSYILAGTDDGNVWLTTNGGAGLSWSNVAVSLPNRWVTQVAFDLLDEQVAYVTFSGLRWDEEISHIYRTDNAGASWTDISANLPETPINGMLVDPDYGNILYVATDLGVYWSNDTGGTWAVLGTGLPGVSTYELKMHHATRLLVAGTHARSIWSLDMSQATSVAADQVPARAAMNLAAAPNPFNPRTTIRYSLPGRSFVELAVYSVAGRKVRTLVSGELRAGDHSAEWNGLTESGTPVASGTYFARLANGNAIETTTLKLVR